MSGNLEETKYFLDLSFRLSCQLDFEGLDWKEISFKSLCWDMDFLEKYGKNNIILFQKCHLYLTNTPNLYLKEF